jgi:hypothetical protein
MYNQKFYIVVQLDGKRYEHGPFSPFNSDVVASRIEILRWLRVLGDDMKVMSESEFLENDREYIINNTGATD